MALQQMKSLAVGGEINRPFVIKRCKEARKWKISGLTATNLANALGDKVVRFRIGLLDTDMQDVQWENECKYVKATMAEFLDWTKSTSSQSNPFCSVDNTKSWAYADYLYMRDLFEGIPGYKVTDQINWSIFGFDPGEGLDAAIWVGSKSAHTPCHYDSYGFNIIYQVCGKKRWTLFPPSDSENLYPTRIPYEESSVFSQVNMLNPDISHFKRFSKCSPHVITLEPGDLLFVPNHWWHFVENLELSISVNAWFPIKEDHERRLQEAITQQLMFSCLHCDASLQKHMIALDRLPTQSDCLASIAQSLKIIANNTAHKSTSMNVKHHQGCSSNKACSCAKEKQMQLFETEECWTLDEYCVEHAERVLGRWTKVKSWYRDDQSPAPVKRKKKAIEDITFTDFVRCLTSPNVVQSVATELKKSFLH